MRPSPTRGRGLLERALASLRARRANLLLAGASDGGTVVDVGCGVPPAFLLSTRAARKIGIDLRDGACPGVEMVRCDVGAEPLPLPDGCADALTALAMVEHLPETALEPFLRETRRVLRPGGVLVLTTPVPRAGPVLRCLAALGLVSPVEIGDHRRLYAVAELRSLAARCGYGRIDAGTFECGMNGWLRAER